MASTGATPRTCRFEIVIERAKPTAEARFSFADAAILRQPQSDCTTFLRALGKYLGFSGELPRPAPIDRLSASLVVLATNQSRSLDGGETAGSFRSRPSGPWTATKLFLADGEGEVFFNLNPQDGVGEFSVKDEDYATIVVTELAKVLLFKAG